MARTAGHLASMSVADEAQKLKDDFAFLGDWEARFTHLIDLGKALPQRLQRPCHAINRISR